MPGARMAPSFPLKSVSAPWKPVGRRWSAASFVTSPSASGPKSGFPPGRHRRSFRRCHYRHVAGWHHTQLELRRRTTLRVQGGRGGRAAAITAGSAGGRRAWKDHESGCATASVSNTTKPPTCTRTAIESTISVTISPVKNRAGAVVGASVIARDITDASGPKRPCAKVKSVSAWLSRTRRLWYSTRTGNCVTPGSIRPSWPGQNKTDLGHTDAEILGGEEGARLTAMKQEVLRSGVGDTHRNEVTFQGETHYFDLTVEPLRERRELPGSYVLRHRHHSHQKEPVGTGGSDRQTARGTRRGETAERAAFHLCFLQENHE